MIQFCTVSWFGKSFLQKSKRKTYEKCDRKVTYIVKLEYPGRFHPPIPDHSTITAPVFGRNQNSAHQSITEKPTEVYYLDGKFKYVHTVNVAGQLHPAIFFSRLHFPYFLTHFVSLYYCSIAIMYSVIVLQFDGHISYFPLSNK